MSAFRSEADIGRTRRPVPDPKRTLSRQTESKFLEAATDRHMRIVTNLIHIKVGTRKNSIVDAIYFRSQTKGGRQAERSVVMVLSDRDDIRAAETGEELLIFDVSDDELERAAPIIGGVASVETLNFATAILGNCACPV
jgi:hypothetical protein